MLVRVLEPYFFQGSGELGILAGKGLRRGAPVGRDVTGTFTAAFGLSFFFPRICGLPVQRFVAFACYFILVQAAFGYLC